MGRWARAGWGRRRKKGSEESEGIAASVGACGNDCGHLMNISSAIMGGLMGGPMEGVSESCSCVGSRYSGSNREVRIRGQLRAILRPL